MMRLIIAAAVHDCDVIDWAIRAYLLVITGGAVAYAFWPAA